VIKIEPHLAPSLSSHLISMSKVSQTLVQIFVIPNSFIAASDNKTRVVTFHLAHSIAHTHASACKSRLATGPDPLVLLLCRINACHDARSLLFKLSRGLTYFDASDDD